IFFFFQAEDGIRDFHVTGVQTCALPICQLLPDSPVAAQVRRFLLSAEESAAVEQRLETARFTRFQERADYRGVLHSLKLGGAVRSEERRVGDEGRVGWLASHAT